MKGGDGVTEPAKKLPAEASEMERLMKLYGDRLLRLCFLYLKDRQLAEDAVQDTFIKVYQNYVSFLHEASEKTWITRIAINVCKNYLGGRWFRQTADSELLETIPAPDETEAALESEMLLRAILQLSEKNREIILLYYYQELKIVEIAGVLEIPEATVSVRLKRARDKLKSILKEWEYD